MSLFPVIPVAASGMEVDQTWLDSIGGNIANANDAVTPGGKVFRAQYIDAQESPDGGVGVAGVVLGSATGVLVSDPGNPLANRQGLVEKPAIDMGTEMVGLVAAQNEYEANAAVVSHATAAYQDALTIGQHI
jgi:flagellar basal-body rod protein FlgC